MRTRREKVNGRMVTLDRALEDARPYLFGLLGLVEGDDPLARMDAQIRRRRTQDAIKRILLRESLNQPLMLVFEDLHQIDDETQALLNLLADSIGTSRVLLLVNYRPEYAHSWGGKTYYTQVRLDPLGKESADQMLSTLLGNEESVAALKRLIAEKSEGNPLFMEEIYQALFEEGVLVRNGLVRLTRSVDTLKIPPTVQAILASRIDRLPVREKELLQALAVIGNEFLLEVARKTVQLSADQLDHSLSRLQEAEFIYEQPVMGDIEYRFKHDLTHHEVYNSLLADRRKLLHERTAQAIESLYRDRLEDHYDDLARHFRLSDNAPKAIEYLRLAGEQAMDRGAYAQTMAAIEPALKLIERLPEVMQRSRAELGVRLLLERTLPVLHGVGSAVWLEAAQRVCELSEQLGDDSTLLRGLSSLGWVYANRGQTLRAREIADRCLALAEQQQDLEMLPAAQLLVARCAYFSGDLLEAASRFKDLIKRLVSAPLRRKAGVLPEPWVFAPSGLALVERLLGRPDEALKLSFEALRRARQFKYPHDVASFLVIVARVRSLRREPDAVRELAEAAQALAEKHGLSGYVNSVAMAWAKAELGQTEQALAELESLADAAPPFDEEILRPQVYMRAGRIEQALEMLNQYLAQRERSEFRHNEAEIYRLKGEAILMRDSSATAEAEKCFRKAIEIARGQSAKWWELRATTSLARLLRDRNSRDEARLMLADIYNWFTEGFDTADLKDAKALLDELSA